MSGETRAEPRRCPLCGSTGAHRFVAHGWGISDCTACAHRYAELSPGADHVQSTYGDAYFEGGGAGYGDYLAEAPLLRAHGRRYAGIVGRHAAPGVMLDVGAAAGLVLQGFQDAGWRGRGIEPNARMAAIARESFGVDVRQGSGETLETDERFDLVSMIQVIAHFTDPQAALKRLAAATRDGGLWLIETWDWRSLTARITGRHWHEYSPPSVLHWYSRESLGKLVQSHGFTVVDSGRPKKRLLASHAKSLLRFKFGSGWLGRAAALPLRLIPDDATLTYPAEDLFWVLARKT